MFPPTRDVKVVVVGDGAVGKTCMLITYMSDEFPEEYVPTVFENYAKELPPTSKCQVDDTTVNLQLCDTWGQEDSVGLYPETDVFLLTFAIDMQVSLEDILNFWWNEVRKAVPKAQLMLVGTKKDLRDTEPGKKYVTPDEAQRVAQQIGAVKYVECSAKTREGLKEVFDEAARAYLTQLAAQ